MRARSSGHMAFAERMGCRHMQVARRIADVGRTAVVAVLGAFSLNRPVDHPEFDRTWIQLATACSASRRAFLAVR
jgi:hypothetical protein